MLGAGTDYGLFLVFRVREQLRGGMEPKEAVITSLTRVGESITFSAATVIAALLSLLVATFQIYSTLGIPLAIGIGVMLLAGLTLLPALLAIFGRAAFWPSKTREGTGKTGVWARVAGAHHAASGGRSSIVGLVIFGGLAVASLGYQRAGFGGETERAGDSDSAAGQALLTKYFPPARQPDERHLQAEAACLGRTGRCSPGQVGLPAAGSSPRSPVRSTRPGRADPAQFAALHAQLGPASRLPPCRRPGDDPGPATSCTGRPRRT